MEYGTEVKNLKITRFHVLLALIVAVLIGCMALPAMAANPLRSWREGTNKRLIITFVEKVSTPGSPSFVAPEDHVATFIRVMIEKSIGPPVENAIGSQVVTTWIEHPKVSEFRREHAFVEPINDEKGKPVDILRMVGKRPIITVGNSERDRGWVHGYL